MSKDLKDLIDTVEKDAKTNAELEAEVNSLKEEINRLNEIIKEQELMAKDQSDSISVDASTIPSETGILKELVTSQRQELIEKDEINEKLKEQIDDLKIRFEKVRDGGGIDQVSDDLIQAQELILAFTEENENYRNQIEELKSQIDSITSKPSVMIHSDQEDTKESGELVNIKRLNFQLMEENGLLRVEIESLKARLQEQINELNSEELQLANQKIEALTAELEDYEAQVQYLKQKIKAEEATSADLTYKINEINNLKEELSKFQNENQRLNKIILELDDSNTPITYSNDNKYNSVIFNFPKKFQIALFMRMYNLLIASDKKIIINSLIKDLNNKNLDVRRVVLKILSEIKEEEVYNTFLELLHDEDWIIRYNVIKALTTFGFTNSNYKEFLHEMTKDVDIDVRELAVKVLEDIT